jgi:hypothetical protein
VIKSAVSMWLRICSFSPKLKPLRKNFRFAVFVIFIILLDRIICSECNDNGAYESSTTNENQHPTPATLLEPTQYESLISPRQEVYDVDNTGRRSNAGEYKSIVDEEGSVGKKDDEFLKKNSVKQNSILNDGKGILSEFGRIYNPILNEGIDFTSEFSALQNPIMNGDKEFSSEFSAIQNPIVNGDKEFSSEFSTLQSPIVNGDKEFSSEFSTLQNPIVNRDNEFSSEFSTVEDNHNLTPVNEGGEFSAIQTDTQTGESRFSGKEQAEMARIQQSLLTSNASLNSTLASKEDEIEYVLNIQNLTAYLIGESSDDYSEFIDDNLVNFVNENAYCRGYDLSVSFECLKQKLMRHIRHLTREMALISPGIVNRASRPVAQTR